MLGGKKAKPLGYTIIEVMIFLAVSGVTFLLAAAFITGRQSETEWPQAVNDLSSQIRSVENDVLNGVSPSNSNFTCIVSGTSLTFSSTAQNQGSNQGCVFLGKVIDFSSIGAVTPPTSLNILTVADCQYESASNCANSGQPTTSILQPTPLDGSLSHSPDLNTTIGLLWGIQIPKVYEGDNSLTGIGFYDVPNVDSSGDASGAQGVQAVALKTSVSSNIDTAIKNTKTTDTSPDIIICLELDNVHQGYITIGGQDSSGGNDDQLAITQQLEGWTGSSC